jgi:ArsR family transcriptional regulator
MILLAYICLCKYTFFMRISELAQLYKALSEPVRLRIINLLRQQEELCVCDIITTLTLPQSVISRHLAYLKKAGIVTSRRQGNWQHYALNLMTQTHPLHFLLEGFTESFANCPDCVEDIRVLAKSTDNCS